MSVILVTGGNQGLGYALIEQLAAHDKSYKIILTARNVENGKKALAELHAKGYDNVSFVQLDITDDDSIDRAHTEVEKKYGKVDYVVLNAAIVGADLPLREAYAKLYDTNVISNIALLKRFKPLVDKSSKPRVLFVSSGLGSVELFGKELYGSFPLDLTLPYSATKSALNLTMTAFKNEWKEAKICAIDPGFCATNLNGYMGPKSPAEGVKAAFTIIVDDDTWKTGQFLQFEKDQTALTVVPW